MRIASKSSMQPFSGIVSGYTPSPHPARLLIRAMSIFFPNSETLPEHSLPPRPYALFTLGTPCRLEATSWMSIASSHLVAQDTVFVIALGVVGSMPRPSPPIRFFSKVATWIASYCSRCLRICRTFPHCLETRALRREEIYRFPDAIQAMAIGTKGRTR